MKNIKNFICNINETKIDDEIKSINNKIKDNDLVVTEDIVFDLLNGISNNGQDKRIVKYIIMWSEELKS